MDWCWTRKTFALRLSSVEEIDPSSSSWNPTSRQWWSDWILENKRSSSESFLVLSSLVWRKVEEQHGRRRRTKEKISVLFWFFRNNSTPPSSSKSFRTQFHWSYSTGQCHYSGRFSQVHLSRRMCDQLTFHHQFRIDTGRTKYEQQIDSILSACGSHRQRTQGSWHDRLGSTASCTIHAWSMEVTSKHGTNIRTRCGSTSTLLWRKNWNSIRHDRTLSFFTEHFHIIESRKLFGWKLEESYTRRFLRHFVLLQRFPRNMTGWKIWVQKLLDNQEGGVARQAKKFPINPTKSKPKSW